MNSDLFSFLQDFSKKQKEKLENYFLPVNIGLHHTIMNFNFSRVIFTDSLL